MSRLWRRQRVRSAIAVLAGLSILATAQASARGITYPVNLLVSSQDRDLKDQIESFCGRELRSLGDVVLTTDRKALYVIGIVAMTMQSKAGRTTGFVLSAVAHEQISVERQAQVLSQYLPMKVPALKSVRGLSETDWNEAAYAIALGDPMQHEVMHSLFAGGTGVEDLRSECGAVIVQFDTTVLKLRREENERDLAILNQAGNKSGDPKQ